MYHTFKNLTNITWNVCDVISTGIVGNLSIVVFQKDCTFYTEPVKVEKLKKETKIMNSGNSVRGGSYKTDWTLRGPTQ